MDDNLRGFLSQGVYRTNIANIQMLHEKLQGSGVSLVVGAGISQSVGLPGWNSLLNSLFGLLFSNVSFRNDQKEALADQMTLFKTTISTHSVAEWRKKLEAFQCGHYKVNNKKVDISMNIDLLQLAEALYMQTPSERDNQLMQKSIFNRMILHIMHSCFDSAALNRKDSTLFQTARLAMRDNTHSIITYNYDNLLEYTMEAVKSDCPANYANVSIIAQTYENRCTQIDNLSKKVIHVHGFMDVTKPNGKISENIVLSESHYNTIEQEIYGWVNQTQTNALNEGSTLFIGFSATDYNFKRILKHCGKICHKHFIIFNLYDYISNIFVGFQAEENGMKRLLNTEEIIEKVISKKDDFSFELAILNQLLTALTAYWNKYNIQPIWCFQEEIADLLEKLN